MPRFSRSLLRGALTLLLALAAAALWAAPASADSDGFPRTCVVKTDHSVWCWGPVSAAAPYGTATPVRMAGIDDGATVGGLLGTVCVLRLTGAVACSGANRDGQLGDGTNDYSWPPVAVGSLGDAIQLSTGMESSCAVRRGGTIACWGRNDEGQLGDGTTTSSNVPVPVSGITDATEVSVGLFHSCAVRTDHTAACWGNNHDGALGNGTTDSSLVPVPVTGLSNVRSVAVGILSSCALLGDGTARCWGSNAFGLLGTGGQDDGETALTPVPVTGIHDAVSITSFGYRFCAVLASGSVVCWGIGYGDAAVGNNAAAMRTPEPVPGLTDAALLTGNMIGACAVRRNHRVSCWGQNALGLLGNGREPLLTEPGLPVQGLTGATAIRSGSLFSCALNATHTVRCWGMGPFGDGATNIFNFSFAPASVPGGTGITNFDVGSGHGCGVTTAHGVRCVGAGSSGQLGNGANDDSFLTAVDVDGITDATAVATGRDHSCALRAGGTVACWGENGSGQLGDGTHTRSSVPVVVDAVAGATAIAAGGASTCAILTDREVTCWGEIASGGPALVPQLSDAINITVGNSHACAVRADRTAVCWGRNSDGQLGDGTHDDSTTPVPVTGLTGVTTVSAGRNASCAIAAGDVVCWGSIADGVLELDATPRRIAGITSATDVALGDLTICATLVDGSATCLGGDLYGIGLFGDGDGPAGHGPQTIPADVVGITDAFTGRPDPADPPDPGGPTDQTAPPDPARPFDPAEQNDVAPAPPLPATVKLARRELSFSDYRVERTAGVCPKAVRISATTSRGRYTQVVAVTQREGACVITGARLTLPQWVWQRKTITITVSRHKQFKHVIRLRRVHA